MRAFDGAPAPLWRVVVHNNTTKKDELKDMELQQTTGGVCAAKGFTAGGMHCGIRGPGGKKDLAMLLSEQPCATAAVYTQNKVKGAPLLLTAQNIADGYARGMICNSGNANTCAPNGMAVAQACCEMAAKATGLDASDFVVASTGVIGQALALEPFEKGLPQLAAALSVQGAVDAAEAIMTTDTVRKEAAVAFTLGGVPCTLGAMAKGSGMINVNMATMLMFITTDVAIAPELLQRALATETETTLNQVCVDNDTSTNDMAVLFANGMAGNVPIAAEGEDYDAFCGALHAVCRQLCRMLAGDGEGASKLLECSVSGAPDGPTARAIAKSVVDSYLFKAAMFGADANWGRALCAIGYTPGDFSVDDIAVTLSSAAGSVLVCKGSMHQPYSEEEAARILSEKEIGIRIDMGQGEAQAEAWGCDLTYDYVKINGDYRS